MARPLKKMILISPSAANMKVWQKIQPLLGDVPALYLPQGREERVRFLEEKEDTSRFILIGGNGREHDESFFFTRGSGMPLKINVDAHPDEYISDDDGGDLVNVDGKLTYVLDCTDRISCSNHMSFTKREGTRIYTIGQMNNSVLDLLRNPMEGFLRRAERMASLEDDGKVALTIDVDGIRGMPVLGQYESRQTTTARRVLDFVREIRSKIGALDVFGLVDIIPDFDLLNPAVDLAKAPRMREMRKFKEAASGAEVSQETLEKVGTYMAMFYAELVTIFLEKD